MAALRVFLPLAICLLLGHQTFAINDAPCQKSQWNNGFDTFVKRHIRAGLPTTLDQNEWENYIKKNGGCDRPTQSFLRREELDKVKAVCTKAGGKTYKENLCISDQLFTFVTVRSQQGTCTIRNVCWVMAALRVFLPLAICLLLGHQMFAHNDAPCQKSKWNNAFDTFVNRHIRAGLPTTLDQNEWQEYITKNNDCDRPTQSFLRHEELDRVKAVCTKAGGKTYKGNLCISNQTFIFVTVRIELSPCTIKRVNQENKYLILACDKLVDGCLPVHFEGNPYNKSADNNAKSCQAPQSRGHARSFKMSGLQ